MNTKLIRHLQKRGCRDTAVPPGFECEITDKGIIIKKFTGLNPNPRIESEYGGVPVIAISEEAFKNNRNIETVNIPEGITEIGEMVFGDCNRLTSITIPDSVTKIGIYAFGDCESLVTIDIPDSLTEIGHDAFFGCKSLTSIVIPEGVTIIAHLVFAHCTSLTSVTIPDSVTKISADAFLNCPNLTGRQRLNTGQDEKNTVHYSSIRSEHSFRMAFSFSLKNRPGSERIGQKRYSSRFCPAVYYSAFHCKTGLQMDIYGQKQSISRFFIRKGKKRRKNRLKVSGADPDEQINGEPPRQQQPNTQRRKIRMPNQKNETTVTVIPRLLTSADVAERLQVNIRTAQKIMRSIPHINIGTGKKNEHLRITEDMLEEYINARIVMPSRPMLSNKNPQIVPRIRAAGTGKIARRPVR